MTVSAPSSFPWRLFSRFLAGQMVLVVLLLGSAGISARIIFRDWFIHQASQQARATLQSLVRDLDVAEKELPEWCAARSGGVFSFALIEASPSGSVICSTIPFEPSLIDPPGLTTDVAEAQASGFGSRLVSDPALGRPVLLAALFAKSRGMILRASMPLPQLREALVFLDRSLAGALLLLGLVFAAYSIWTGRRLVGPLGRLLRKARRVGEREDSDSGLGSGVGSAGESELESDEDAGFAGEWSDLETSLDQIRTSLRSKTETLTREREELATLMSAISDAILAVDRSGNPLFYNSRFALLFSDRGLAERRSTLGELFRSPEVLEAFHAALATGQSQSAEARLHLMTQDPTPHYFSISVAPLRRGEEVYGAVGIFHDINELKRAEQIRIDFVANVSHELRTPLTSIKGYTDTLREDLARGEMSGADKFLEIITRNADRLMSLISDLLDLSSLESGAEVNKSLVDTWDLTRRVLSQLESVRARKGQVIETRLLASMVNAQPGRVDQVLTNLLENAMKYVPQGGRIEVIWEKRGKGVALRVQDNGPGIPHEHQPRLFERFYRIDKARSRELGGTGLGLAIVKHIMQVHGGSVHVSSEPGKGAEFVCQFPD